MWHPYYLAGVLLLVFRLEIVTGFNACYISCSSISENNYLKLQQLFDIGRT
jgi:hypothetical protein